MTAPQRAGGLDANARGLAVLAVAVVIGLLLMLNTGDSGSAEQVSAGGGDGQTSIDTSGLTPDDSSTTTTPDDTTTTSSTPIDDVRAPGEVKVIVLNGGGPTGTAASTTETIGDKGYDMQKEDNASAKRDTTAVYYAEGYAAEAAAVAEVLGKATDVVEAMPETSPGAGADSANVVVVLGRDTPPAGTSGTSGSSGTTTTTAAN